MDPTPSGSVFDALSQRFSAGLHYLPQLLSAVLVLTVGWLLARIVRRAVRKLAAVTNRFLERIFPRGVLATARVSSFATTLIGEILFWVILLATFTVAARVAGLITISGWLDRLTSHLPNLVAGLAIVVVAWFFSVFVREQIAPRSETRQTEQNLYVARLAQGLILVVGLIVGLDQVGIDVVLLVWLTVVVAGALLAGFAGAFALGARRHCGNLIGARTARRQLYVGTRVRIGEFEGEILEITPTQIALDTDNGKTLIPGSCIDEVAILIVPPEGDRSSDDVS